MKFAYIKIDTFKEGLFENIFNSENIFKWSLLNYIQRILTFHSLLRRNNILIGIYLIMQYCAIKFVLTNIMSFPSFDGRGRGHIHQLKVERLAGKVESGKGKVMVNHFSLKEQLLVVSQRLTTASYVCPFGKD
jgi:hypothetical protein